MSDGIGLTNVRQELVTQPLALRRAGHESGDIDELHGRRQDLLRLDDVGKYLQTKIRHGNDADVRLDRAERVVLGGDLSCRQRVKQCRFANVGQADDATGNSHHSVFGV